MDCKLHKIKFGGHSLKFGGHSIKFGGQLDILRTSLVVIQSFGTRLVVIQCSNRHKNHPKKS